MRDMVGKVYTIDKVERSDDVIWVIIKGFNWHIADLEPCEHMYPDKKDVALIEQKRIFLFDEARLNV